MSKVVSFMVVTLDGFVEGPNGEFDWPNVDEEFNEFAVAQLGEIGTLLFGRVGYEGMASYWPTPQAQQDDPLVAGLMNDMPKVVFSATLDKADWSNTTLVRDDAAATVARLKQQPGQALALFGSPNLTVSLINAGLVDEIRVMVNPILLGDGRSLFNALDHRVGLTHLDTRTFKSGNVLLSYGPSDGRMAS
jgi:dihydrofolate reductase